MFRKRREKRAEVHGLGIELAKGISEPLAANLTDEVSCRLFVKNRPTTDGLSVWFPRRPPEEKHGRMLSLRDERFQAARSHDSKVAVSHKDLSTTVCSGK